jgi:hypothetical protein
MKTITKMLVTVFALGVTLCMNISTPSIGADLQQNVYGSGPQVSVSLQIFYDQLSPYGTWVSHNNYGYVWMPDAGPDFYPYSSAGRWVFTDMGWTWYSDYSWGWAPFHYGRWFYDNYYGWMWMPDTQWGPAWVAWRSGGDYYGWAPLEPGISISIVFGGSYHPPYDRWVFVRNRDLNRNNISSYTVNQTNNTTIINNTTVIQNSRSANGNTTYITGPERNDVQRVTGKQIKQVSIRENSKPGQQLSNHELRTYKPQVQGDNESGRRSTPSKIETLNNVKPVQERHQANPQHNQNSEKQTNTERQSNSERKMNTERQPNSERKINTEKQPNPERKTNTQRQPDTYKQSESNKQPNQNNRQQNQRVKRTNNKKSNK